METDISENIIAQMSAYNFNAPVTVTVSFEDSDEEKSSSVHIKTEVQSDNETETKDNCEVGNVLIKNEIELPKEIDKNVYTETSRLNINNDNNKSKSDDLQEILSSLGHTTEYYTGIKNTITDDKQSKKRRLDDSSYPPTSSVPTKIQETVQTQDCVGYTRAQCEQNGQANAVTTNIPTTPVSEAINYNNLKEQTYTSVQCEQNGKASVVTTNIPTIPITETNSSNNFKERTNAGHNMKHYIQDLIYTVSNHMVYIMESYHRYNGTESAYDQFVRVKEHLFNLSYCTVTTIMVPQENNANFIKNFINATVICSKHKFSYAQIAALYTEMLEWAKAKKKSLNYLPAQLETRRINPQCNNTILKQQLAQPSQPLAAASIEQTKNKQAKICKKSSAPQEINYNTPNGNTSSSQESSRSCIFSSGPPGREISINFDTNLLNQQNKVTYPNTYASTNTTNILASSQPRDYSRSQCQYSTTQPPITTTIHTTYRNNPYYQMAYNVQTKQQQAPQNQTNYQNAYSSQRVVSSVSIPQTSATVTQPTPVRNPPPAYSARYPQLYNQIQTFTPQTYADKQPVQPAVFQNEAIEHQQIQSETTRSLSTDSGFMSPLHFNTPAETLNTSIPVQENQSPLTPMITLVTSLNPKASYIDDGLCTICRRITNQKCLGCLQVYYCSYECQRADWTHHRKTCKKS